jgi:hypothetical protein
MALIVEDGTVVSGANSYVSQADADAYHLDRGNAAWSALTSTQKDANLIKATQFIDSKYRSKWAGSLFNILQPLCWPRTFVTDLSALLSESTLPPIPPQLKYAVCEAALLFISTDLNAATDRGVQREKVGEIETSYFDGGSRVDYSIISGLLVGLFKNTNTIIRS